jgi:hypothetical protein
MKDVFARLAANFFSTIVFRALYRGQGAAFSIQSVAFRLLVINRIRAAAIGHV